MSDLSSLSAESRAIINTFLSWAKQDRDSAVANCSKDLALFRDTRILQSTYTREETTDLLDSVASTVRAAVSESHEKLANSVGELVRRVLAEADMQRVLINVQPLEALNAKRSLSATDLATQKMLAAGRPNALAPMDAPGGGGDTAKQLAQANQMIRSLREKLHAVEDKYRQVMDEKSRLSGANYFLDGQLATEEQRLAHAKNAAEASMNAATRAGEQTVESLQKDMAVLRDSHGREVSSLTKKVNELMKEQQGKLSESSQFQAMQKMLREKTAQVKKLRDLLRPYNPAAAGADDDIATDDDDD